MEEHEEIRKPGLGHPVMLLAYAVVGMVLGLLWWVFG